MDGISLIKLAYLLIGHLIGDGLFSKWLQKAKRSSLFCLGIHCAVYAVVVSLFIYVFMAPIFALWEMGVLFASHFVIDYWKCYIAKTEAKINARNLRYSVLDQILHLLVLAGIVFI